MYFQTLCLDLETQISNPTYSQKLTKNKQLSSSRDVCIIIQEILSINRDRRLLTLVLSSNPERINTKRPRTW